MAEEIKAGMLVSPVQMQQLELQQMEMALQPPEPPAEEQGIDPADYDKGNI